MKYDNYRKVIDRIYKLGKEKGFTIKELASICGVSEDYFASCRFKKNYPNTDCIIKVSQNLDVSIDFILSGVDNKVLKDLNVVQTGISSLQKDYIVSCQRSYRRLYQRREILVLSFV